MSHIPNTYYRLSIKALILNETRTKFLVVQEDNGKWEPPGGGLEWGENPREGLAREIKEEMGLEIAWMANNPSYLVFSRRLSDGGYVAAAFYETKLTHYEFTPTAACVATRFVAADEVASIDAFPGLVAFAEHFNPSNHQ